MLAASGEPGKTIPPTVRTMAILESAGAPCQRSTARVNARRTRGSSNGFLFWFGVNRLPQFQSLDCTVILSPSAFPTVVLGRWRHAAELDRGAVGADRLDTDRLFVGIDPGEAVEIRQAFVVIVRVFDAFD